MIAESDPYRIHPVIGADQKSKLICPIVIDVVLTIYPKQQLICIDLSTGPYP
jgi:hypothetical protein